jgi:DNA primase
VMALCSTPTIAVTGTSGLLNIELPDSIHTIRIFQDNDEAGMIAAQKAEQRFIAEGKKTERIQPPPPHKDFNEWLLATQAPQE